MRGVFYILIFFLSQSNLIGQEIMLLKSTGKVVIGDTSQIMTPGNYNLYVQNGILTERVKVALKSSAEWADDAFLHTPTLNEVEESIHQKSHLTDMPSAETLVKEGYELKEMDARLLQQIEWMWQHIIALNKQNEALAKEVEALKQKMNTGSVQEVQND